MKTSRKYPCPRPSPPSPRRRPTWSTTYGFGSTKSPRRTRGPNPVWTVFNPEGHILGFVETPAGLDIYEIGEDYILGLATDDLGV